MRYDIAYFWVDNPKVSSKKFTVKYSRSYTGFSELLRIDINCYKTFKGNLGVTSHKF